jgi:hypothetical protein
MTNKRLWLVLVIVTLVLLFLEGCATRIAPSVSQTVITVTRHSSVNGIGSFEIYLDGRIAQTMERKPKEIKLRSGEWVSIPVNNGVHSIYVKFGTQTSESINFTADGKTLAFVATMEAAVPLRKLVLSRSVVEDDTGSMTNREVQSAF